MADNSSQNEVLMQHAPSAETVTPAPASSSSKRWGLAGLAVLACLLLAGQGISIYSLLHQQQQITALKDATHTLKTLVTQQRNTGPARVMQVPMGMSLLTDVAESDEKTPQGRRTPLTKLQKAMKSSGAAPTGESPINPSCAVAAAVHVLGCYRPQCDAEGHYLV
ncbi:uncharacterized protein LOC134439133 isoform X2 [Engraulis encrasicolus]|uniref:uncharacterized protein LOC134439133 isoform X2 n=1 Tax=Engraulis encrasicolus TaxID=184585 RepID=UPI002FD3EDDA